MNSKDRSFIDQVAEVTFLGSSLIVIPEMRNLFLTLHDNRMRGGCVNIDFHLSSGGRRTLHLNHPISLLNLSEQIGSVANDVQGILVVTCLDKERRPLTECVFKT